MSRIIKWFKDWIEVWRYLRIHHDCLNDGTKNRKELKKELLKRFRQRYGIEDSRENKL